MICKKCGAQFEEGVFCPECGTRVEKNSSFAAESMVSVQDFSESYRKEEEEKDIEKQLELEYESEKKKQELEYEAAKRKQELEYESEKKKQELEYEAAKRKQELELEAEKRRKQMELELEQQRIEAEEQAKIKTEQNKAEQRERERLIAEKEEKDRIVAEKARIRKEESEGKLMATLSVVAGLISVFTFGCLIVPEILGIVFALKGKKKGKMRKRAIAGFALSVIAAFIIVFAIVYVCLEM